MHRLIDKGEVSGLECYLLLFDRGTKYAKVNPYPVYPPEEGRYLRGMTFLPVAVAIILNCDADKIPSGLGKLAMAGIESGAALSGTMRS